MFLTNKKNQRVFRKPRRDMESYLSGFTPIEVACMFFCVLILGASVLLAYNSSSVKARDRKRVSDVTQLQGVLKAFYNENGSFPISNNGQPADFDAYVKWPTPPGPADGSCTNEQNTYYYSKISSTDYNILFCLGGSINNYSAGVRSADPRGIR